MNVPGSGRASSDAAGSSEAQFILRKRGPLHLQDGEAAPIRHLLSHELKAPVAAKMVERYYYT